MKKKCLNLLVIFTVLLAVLGSTVCVYADGNSGTVNIIGNGVNNSGTGTQNSSTSNTSQSSGTSSTVSQTTIVSANTGVVDQALPFLVIFAVAALLLLTFLHFYLDRIRYNKERK